MSGPNELLEVAEPPEVTQTKRLNTKINNELADYNNRTRTLWLFTLAVEYYLKLEDDKQEYDIDDYYLAAQMVMRDDRE